MLNHKKKVLIDDNKATTDERIAEGVKTIQNSENGNFIIVSLEKSKGKSAHRVMISLNGGPEDLMRLVDGLVAVKRDLSKEVLKALMGE